MVIPPVVAFDDVPLLVMPGGVAVCEPVVVDGLAWVGAPEFAPVLAPDCANAAPAVPPISAAARVMVWMCFKFITVLRVIPHNGGMIMNGSSLDPFLFQISRLLDEKERSDTFCV